MLRVTDLAGNFTDSDDFVLKVDTSIPTTTVTINPQTTTDSTPILSGLVSAGLTNGEYVVITVNDKTYTSETGGAVVVDPENNTWYLQLPDGDALSVKNYDVTAQVKSSAGNGNTAGLTTGSLIVGSEESLTPAGHLPPRTTPILPAICWIRMGCGRLWPTSNSHPPIPVAVTLTPFQAISQ